MLAVPAVWPSVMFPRLWSLLGASLVLVAFGATATFKHKGLVAGGAVAVMACLVLWVDQLTAGPTECPAAPAFVELAGVTRGQRAITAQDQEELVGGFKRIGEAFVYRFVVPSGKPQASALRLYVVHDDEKEQEDPTYYIESTAFVPSANRWINWTYDRAAKKIRDAEGKVISTTLRERQTESSSRMPPLTPFTATALAAAIEHATPETTTSLEGLTSDDPTERRVSRDDLVAAGPAAVGPVLRVYREAPQEYRVKLGALVVLSSLTEDAQARDAMTSTMRDADWDLITAAVVDDDPTVRLYASVLVLGLKNAAALRPLTDALAPIRGTDRCAPKGVAAAANGVRTLNALLRVLPAPDRAIGEKRRHDLLTSTALDLAGRRILWIDDNPSNNDLERQDMSAFGVTFENVRTGKVGLNRLAEERFDAIISDFERPGDPLSGYALAAALKTLDGAPPYIIYATGATPERIETAKSHGVLDETNRPDVLYSIIVRALGCNRPLAADS